MAALLVPPQRPSRARALSTGVRPPLSLDSLAPCSRALSLLPPSRAASSPSPPLGLPLEQPPRSPPPSARGPARPPAMFPVLLSRAVHLWRALWPGASSKEPSGLFDCPQSSPRSSTDTDYILPLSSSPHKMSFDAADLAPPPNMPLLFRSLTFPTNHASLALVVLLFPVTTAATLFCLSTLPIASAWPRTLSDLARVGQDLNAYSQSGPWQTAHILVVLSVAALWKHAWSVPGSVLWNVLSGVLFHPLLATLVMAMLTTTGSVFSTLLAAPLAPLLTHLFPRSIEFTRSILEGSSTSTAATMHASSEPKPSMLTTTPSASRPDSTPAWVRLSILRLIGVVPWSALNIACGIAALPLRDCTLGAFIGSLPWTAVTCQIGDILQTVSIASQANSDAGDFASSATLSAVLTQPQILLELVFLSVLSLAPILWRDRLRQFVLSMDGEPGTEGHLMNRMGEKSTSPSYRHDEDERLGSRGRRLPRQRWVWKRISMSIPRWPGPDSFNRPNSQSFKEVMQ